MRTFPWQIGRGARIEVEHLHKIARDLWVKKEGRPFLAVAENASQRLSEASQATVDGAAKFSGRLSSERVRGRRRSNGITTWERYKSASRANRGTPLDARIEKLTIRRVFETLLQFAR